MTKKFNEFDLKESLIFLAVCGSHAYGLNDEHSDVDVRGICVPTRKYFVSPFSNFEQYVGTDPAI